jgi:hypothetical protein
MQAFRSSFAVSRRAAFTQQRAAFSVSALARKDATDSVKETAESVRLILFSARASSGLLSPFCHADFLLSPGWIIGQQVRWTSYPERCH